MTRSFAPDAAPAYVARPPVGEEGAAYAVVRRYLWPDETPPKLAPGEGTPRAAPQPPVSRP